MKTILLLLLLGIFSCSTRTTDDKPIEELEPIECGGCKYEDVEGEVDGMRAKFRIAYITQEERWLFNSETKLMDSSLAAEAIKEFIPKFPGVAESIGIIAVGAASQEGRQIEEERRSGARADIILSELRTASQSNTKELYKLNLGQFKTKVDLNQEQTDYQRRMILIGILEKDKQLNVDQIKFCLQNAMSYSKGLNFKTYSYSIFDFTKMN